MRHADDGRPGVAEFLRKYADIAVRVGANVQPGQPAQVFASVEHVPLVRALGQAAWEAGASDVQLVYYDLYERYLLARFGEDSVLERTPVVQRAMLEAALEHRGASVVVIGDEAPAYFAQLDPGRIAKTTAKLGSELAQRLMNENRDAWTVIAYPEESWAVRVFGEPDVNRLIDEISAACRLDETDPVEAWRRHLDLLEARAAALDEREIDSLRVQGPGTDLLVGLLPGSRWLAGRHETHWGQVHCVNLPTEEVFTTPDFRRTEGVLAATRAVAVGGVVVEGIKLRFAGGRIVEATADASEAFLRQHIATDEGASRLGEIALVAGSRVGARNLLFFNTLFDENATSHVAYGMAYTAPVAGASELDAAAQLERGINQSNVHVDFPIGGPDVEITAICGNGETVAVLRGDDWVL